MISVTDDLRPGSIVVGLSLLSPPGMRGIRAEIAATAFPIAALQTAREAGPKAGAAS
jgi:hypothetical protein